MKTIRSFIAIELSDEARGQLAALQNRLKPQVPPHTIRWTAPQNIHLTLHFLGEIPEEQIEAVSQALAESVAGGSPFSLELAAMGCFPNLRRPRVIWVGLSGDTRSLQTVRQTLGQKLAEAINFTPDQRPFAPHLTIGRVKKGIPSRHLRQLGQVLELEQPQVGRLATLRVTKLILFQSVLKPTGPVYTPLVECNL